MIVKFTNIDYEESEDELLVIEEIVDVLGDISPELYIKESDCINIVLVELGSDSVEAAKILKKSEIRIISQVIPINQVVETDLIEILKTVEDLSVDRMDPGDSYSVESFVINNEDLDSNAIEKIVKMELEKYDFIFNKNSPIWKVYVEIIGKDTGISVLKRCQY
jgi:tRNA(Ser,Leu) C12 N-acetylase TAN1